jgi:ADP-dependent phosphofructokinase/glucokinase
VKKGMPKKSLPLCSLVYGEKQNTKNKKHKKHKQVRTHCQIATTQNFPIKKTVFLPMVVSTVGVRMMAVRTALKTTKFT